MINFKRYCLTIFGFLVLFSCKKTDEQPLTLAAPSNPNLTYFGYTLIDVGWDNPTDKTDKVNYADEIAPFANLADILVLTPSDDIRDRLSYMNELELKALIHINELFFEITGETDTKSGVDYGLRSDYMLRWDTFIATNNFTTDYAQLAGFYLGEEPFWNSISADELTLASDYIKATVPAVPILIVEAYPSIDELVVPVSADWVGFDHYFIGKPSENETYLSELKTLKSKLTPTQNILLVLDAHYISFAHGSSGISLKEMDVVAKSYYDLANSDNQIIGMIGYHWPSGFEFKSATGARHFPEGVLNLHKEMGKKITGK